MSVRTLEESFANFLAVNTKVLESVIPVPDPVLLPECPICMEVIVTTKNIVITECGHTFHCSCLMTNVAHNGFGCPYCRTAMAEEVDVEQSEYEGDGSITDSVNAAIHEDDMLRGFRMFHNLCDGIEHERIDIDDEQFYQAYLEQEAMVIDQNNNNSTENQPDIVAESADQEPEWDANGNIWDAIANAAAERDAAAAEWDANGNIWNDVANAAAQRDALVQNESNPDQETEWDNFASVAGDYRAATLNDDIERDADHYDYQYDDNYEEFSFSDRYRDDEESLWSDDEEDSNGGRGCGFQQGRGIYPNAR
jgi:hypothetical protein